MNEVKSSRRNRMGKENIGRRLDSTTENSSNHFENSFTSLALSRARSFHGFEDLSKKLETHHETAGETPRSEKGSRLAKKVRGRAQKTIGDMFVEDEFEAISFGDDDFTTTSATTATTRSSAAKIVPVKVESTVDMDPFANIDNGFSDWHYGSKEQTSSSPEKSREKRSRRRSSMSNVPSEMNAYKPPKEEPKVHRRSRRSSLDMALKTDNSPKQRRADASVSSGVSAKSNGSRSQSSSDSKPHRRDQSRDGKGRSERKQRSDRVSRRRASMGATKENGIEPVSEIPPKKDVDRDPEIRVSRQRASIGVSKELGIEPVSKASSSEAVNSEQEGRRGTPRRASLNMVAGTTSLATKDPPRRNARRASLSMAAPDTFQSGFTTQHSKVQEWDESGFKVIK